MQATATTQYAALHEDLDTLVRVYNQDTESFIEAQYSYPKDANGGECDSGQEYGWTSVIACCDASPVLKAQVREFDPVAIFVKSES